jgi:hypothetical protein
MVRDAGIIDVNREWPVMRQWLQRQNMADPSQAVIGRDQKLPAVRGNASEIQGSVKSL